MSIKVMSWVFENGPEDTAERLVLLALADYAQDNGEWSPSMAGIAKKSGMTERGARGVVRRLENDGWIEVRIQRGRGHRNAYRVLMDRPAKPERETRNGVPISEIKPERDDAKTGTRRPENRNSGSARPSRTINKPSNTIRARLLDVLSEDVADAFIEHRKAKRAKLTERAADLIARKLAEVPDPDAVVELSVMNGWAGVFPEAAGRRDENRNPTAEEIRAMMRGERYEG